MSDPTALSIREAAELIRVRKLSPVELVHAALNRIQRLDSTVHAFGTLTADSALREAAVAEAEIGAGGYRGPLHGIPVAFKDNIDVAGVRCTAGSRLFQSRTAAADATVVTRLKHAGAIGLGKLAMGELACSTSATALFECPRNPWNTDFFAGDSSSGSAVAVGARLALASLGTDDGGSLLTPAAACGIVGLKPSYGRVSRTGVVLGNLATSHIGPMTRTAYDCALVLQVIAGHDGSDAFSSPTPTTSYTQTIDGGVRGLRVGVVRELDKAHQPGASAPVAAAVQAAVDNLARLGARIVPIELGFLRAARTANIVLIAAETFGRFREDLRTRPGIFGEQLRDFLYLSCAMTAADYAQALKVRTATAKALNELFRHVDVLVTPTTSAIAPPYEAITDSARLWNSMLGDDQISWTSPYSLAGTPAISIPCGWHAGLPIGLQIGGRFLDEATVLRVAHSLESESACVRLCPPL